HAHFPYLGEVNKVKYNLKESVEKSLRGVLCSTSTFFAIYENPMQSESSTSSQSVQKWTVRPDKKKDLDGLLESCCNGGEYHNPLLRSMEMDDLVDLKLLLDGNWGPVAPDESRLPRSKEEVEEMKREEMEKNRKTVGSKSKRAKKRHYEPVA
uniref:Bromo domain-containing protein n=1 Tax=Steinernema glaseri TaxID=37863 RepID=A0A1I7YIH5_9BILA